MADKTLSIKYVGDASSVKNALSDIDRSHSTFASKVSSVGGSISRGLGSGLRSAARVGAVAFTALGVAAVAYGKKAIEAYQESAQVGAQTNAVIESTGGAANVTAKHVGELAQSIRDYSGIDDEAVQSGENMLLTFKNIRNEAGKGNDVFDQSTKILADMSVALGTDMKTSAIGLGKALNDPIRGVTALRRVGVTFTEQQEDQIKTLVESGRTMDAQKLILRELAGEFGGSAAAMGKANPAAIIKSQMGDISETIGKTLLPVITNLFASLKPVLERLGPVLGDIVAKLAPVFGSLLSALTPVIDALGGAFATVLQKLAPVLEKMAPFLAQLAQALGEILVALAPLIPPLGELLVAIAPLLVLAAKLAGVLVRLLVPAINAIVKVITVVVNAVVQFVTKWKTAWEAVKAAAIAVWNAIKTALVTAWNAVKTAAETIWNAIREAILAVWKGLKTAILAVFNPIKDALLTAWRTIKDVARTAWNAVKEAILTAIDAITAPIERLIDLIERAISALNRLAQAFLSADVEGKGLSDIIGGGRASSITTQQTGLGYTATAAARPGVTTGATTQPVVVNLTVNGAVTVPEFNRLVEGSVGRAVSRRRSL